MRIYDETETFVPKYFGIILKGQEKEFKKLEEYIKTSTGLDIKFIKTSYYYLKIQPAPPL